MDIERELHELNVHNNRVYTRVVDEVMKPNIIEIYKHMRDEIGYNQEIWYGDMDVYVSIEEAYEKRERSFDALIINNVVSCADQPITVALIEKNTYSIPLCKCVASFGEKKEQGHVWNDHRDWVLEGLDTLRDHNWKFGYEDLRDPNLVFERACLWEKVMPDKAYNGWTPFSYGCGFNTSYLLYAEREIRWAMQSITERTYHLQGQ
ncbi:hypothetical protein VPFG_00149 [Vibrio phage nt-1]|uniref:Uncharacterized protein n=1 Tax=Vibrio phage nt-1 TaxID=115992 RepID=R9TEH1_9CAUD|nr:hypothetical protein VPFG_00149 [Vibrio phage nt-1]AGN30151.1 hypothetical protein VPFG_00149 [Vibrio phage nt-1]